jgi:hypothetical protein
MRNGVWCLTALIRWSCCGSDPGGLSADLGRPFAIFSKADVDPLLAGSST